MCSDTIFHIMVYRLKVKKIILHGYTTNLILFFLRTENIECLLN